MGIDCGNAEVSVVVVTTNTRDWIRQCLVSLRANEDVSQEVIVVENASEDGSREMLEQEFPEVRLIVNEERLGFAHNNNLGADVGTAPVLVFLNPDAETPAGSLRPMLDAMGREPDAGALGPRVLDGRGGVERSTGAFPTIVSISLDRLLERVPALRPGLQQFSQRHYAGYDRPRAVDWVTGACLWMRRELFLELDGWDISSTLYYEDIDLCYRIRKAGHRNLYVPQSTVIHYHNQTPMGQEYRKNLMRTGLAQFVRKHYGPLRRSLYPRVLRLPRL